jgi:hypothetical protein
MLESFGYRLRTRPDHSDAWVRDYFYGSRAVARRFRFDQNAVVGSSPQRIAYAVGDLAQELRQGREQHPAKRAGAEQFGRIGGDGHADLGPCPLSAAAGAEDCPGIVAARPGAEGVEVLGPANLKIGMGAKPVEHGQEKLMVALHGLAEVGAMIAQHDCRMRIEMEFPMHGDAEENAFAVGEQVFVPAVAQEAFAASERRAHVNSAFIMVAK